MTTLSDRPPQLRKNSNRQHHVAQVYLRAWAKDQKLFRLQNGQIRQAAVRDVAVQNRFYQLRPLSVRDEAFIRMWISAMPEASHAAHLQTLAIMTLPFKVRETHGSALAAHPEADAEVEHLTVNLQEQWHSGVESNAAPLLQAMRDGDISFYADDKICSQFLVFLTLQHFRTKANKDRTLRFLAETDFERTYGINVENCWPVLCEIMAHTVGGILYLERRERRAILLANNTGTEFITGDQPLINLFGHGDYRTPPEFLSFYYPLSPTRALILTEVDGRCEYASETLTAAQVADLNQRMAKAANLQVFATSAICLEPFASRSSVPTSQPSAMER
jgi:hypothetical protein